MKHGFTAAFAAALFFCGCVTAPSSTWEGKKVAVFGDSISDARLKRWKHWWKWTEEELGCEMRVFAANGRQWNDIPRQTDLMKKEGGGFDAILIFMGTNDFNSDVPIGKWWNETEETVNRDGKMVRIRRRLPDKNMTTVRGRINTALEKIKTEHPLCQVVLMTPVRRGYFRGSAKNVQPEDSYANGLGIFFEEYVRTVKEAGEIWSVPVIDTYAESGLVPSLPSYSDCCNRVKDDRLHLSTEGCRRLAKTVAARLRGLPPGFRR